LPVFLIFASIAKRTQVSMSQWARQSFWAQNLSGMGGNQEDQIHHIASKPCH